MVESTEQEDKKRNSKTVARFPDVFRASHNANLQKAADWWRKRDSILAMTSNSLSQARDGRVQRVDRKASQGRGRKRSAWVEWPHGELKTEFVRLRSMRIKVSRTIVIDAARHLLTTSTGQFNAVTMERGRPIAERIDSRWIQTFMERHDIVARK